MGRGRKKKYIRVGPIKIRKVKLRLPTKAELQSAGQKTQRGLQTLRKGAIQIQETTRKAAPYVENFQNTAMGSSLSIDDSIFGLGQGPSRRYYPPAGSWPQYCNLCGTKMASPDAAYRHMYTKHNAVYQA